jgi:hypothetical protein
MAQTSTGVTRPMVVAMALSLTAASRITTQFQYYRGYNLYSAWCAIDIKQLAIVDVLLLPRKMNWEAYGKLTFDTYSNLVRIWVRRLIRIALSTFFFQISILDFRPWAAVNAINQIAASG